MKSAAKKNLKKPEGKEGYITSCHLEKENMEINSWAISMLSIQSHDKVLEIGFGSGATIEAIIDQASEGYVAGIDYSELMYNQAAKRNSAAIAQGRVELKQADVNNLPLFKEKFNKVISINNVMYWKDPVLALYNLRQILEPGGGIALVIQRSQEHFNAGFCNEEIGFYIQCLSAAGYVNANVVVHSIKKAEKNYSKTERKMGLSSAGNSQPNMITGIAIYGTNPKPFDSITEYYNTINRQRAHQLLAYTKTNTMTILKYSDANIFPV